MRLTSQLPFVALLFVLATGCSSTSGAADDPTPGPDAAPEAAPEAAPASQASEARAAVPDARATAPDHGTAPYTETQAQRGVEVFREVCSDCHYRSELRGAQFQFEWRRRTVWDFYEIVTETMPEEDPGSLTPQQYVDVVAFVLSLNGFAAGDQELSSEETLLDGYGMAAPGGGTP